MTELIYFHAVVIFAVTVLGLSKGGFAGVGVISTPLVAAISDPMTAIALMLPIMLTQDAISVWIYRRDWHRGYFWALLPGAFLGVGAAYLFTAALSEKAILFALGLLSVSFAAWQLLGAPKGKSRDVSPAVDRVLAFLSGLGSGIASAIAHAGAAPYQVYMIPKQLRKEIYVGTSVMFFAAVNLFKLPSYAALNILQPELLWISLYYVPLALFSSWLGAYLVQRVDTAAFNKIVSYTLVAVGSFLIAKAFTL